MLTPSLGYNLIAPRLLVLMSPQAEMCCVNPYKAQGSGYWN